MADLQLYSKKDLELARTKGQVVGWFQGAGALLLLGLVVNIAGWIPMLIVGGVVVFVLAKVLLK
jgi:hypothetical protein